MPVVGGRRRPAIPTAMGRRRVPQSFLEPRMLARGVVQYEIDEHTNVMLVRRGDERLEVIVRPIVRLDLVVVGDVVAVIARRFRHGHQPDAVGAEPGDVVELLGETAQVTDAVTIAVVERTHKDFVANIGMLWPLNQQTQYEQHGHGITSTRASESWSA